MRTFINKPIVIWLLFALPGLAMISGWLSGSASSEMLLHPTGEFSARFTVIAMLVGPLAGILGQKRWLMWLLNRRRWLGVAAFAYGLLHLLFYIDEKGTIPAMIAELPYSSIWSGWIAFILMVPMALTSNHASLKKLGRTWKRVQQLAYPLAVLTLLHWIWVSESMTAGLVHFAPVAAAWAILAFKKYRKPGHVANA